jgi:hypothetical protein
MSTNADKMDNLNGQEKAMLQDIKDRKEEGEESEEQEQQQ